MLARVGGRSTAASAGGGPVPAARSAESVGPDAEGCRGPGTGRAGHDAGRPARGRGPRRSPGPRGGLEFLDEAGFGRCRAAPPAFERGRGVVTGARVQGWVGSCDTRTPSSEPSRCSSRANSSSAAGASPASINTWMRPAVADSSSRSSAARRRAQESADAVSPAARARSASSRSATAMSRSNSSRASTTQSSSSSCSSSARHRATAASGSPSAISRRTSHRSTCRPAPVSVTVSRSVAR